MGQKAGKMHLKSNICHHVSLETQIQLQTEIEIEIEIHIQRKIVSQIKSESYKKQGKCI